MSAEACTPAPAPAPSPAQNGHMVPQKKMLFSFISPSPQGKGSLRASLSDAPALWHGRLILSQEEGVMFPAVHFVDHHAETLPTNPLLGRDTVAQQGLYKEVRHIIPPVEQPEAKGHHATSYILLGFKNVDNGFHQVMLDTWRDWTGARYIYMYLPDELGLVRISLYQRQLPANTSSLFTYIVLVECRGVVTTQHQAQLMDFVQRLRAERVTGYVSVYTAEPEPFSLMSNLAPPVPVRTSLSLISPRRYGHLYGMEAIH